MGCGSEARSQTSGQLSFESVLKANNFDDELSLSVLMPKFTNLRQTPINISLFPCMHASVSEVLQLCAEDAEETLYELGFGCDEPQVTVRIPPRFFTFPSMAQGINFRLFLDSQLRRIREEDPSLSLASRFRQVQVLTAMANAFYSLYSHVSRTPLQKLATPEFTFSSSPVERIERFRSSIRSEPRSPVERLKDTVSKMCLYTGSPRGSDSTSPQPSPRKRSSLPDVVDVVLEKAKTGGSKRLDMGEYTRSNSAVDGLVTDDDKSCDSGKVGQTRQTVADTDALQKGDKKSRGKRQGSKQTDNADAAENSVKPADLDSRTHSVRVSVASSLSGETVIETDHCFFSHQPEMDSCSSQSGTSTVHLKPVAKVTHDLICPQIVESVHQVPFCTRIPKTNTLPPICSEAQCVVKSCPGSHEPHKQMTVSEPDQDRDDVAFSVEAGQLGASRLLPVLAPDSSSNQCCITVTGWEGDDVSSCSLSGPDSSHTSAVPPVQACEESFNEGKSQYLNPLTNQVLGLSSNLQQVNSFELEEVQ
ncbi:hypothetical protein L3Q82_024723 [Scortum barcoo]|uniref:Uncharacterized protein n=1 Tax=Scortum barcoo TaxID=214431 RepID=A0ACB8WPL7_9TELE|nr:hypothetical protein L3Q82_024723 [Scortum barcoo]